MAKLISSPIKLTPPTAAKKPRKPRNPEVFDQDSAWKDFVTKNIWDCVAALSPELYAAIDKSVPPEFLEQEIINAMRGKYKLKGKERKTDKLVKFRLLNGEDYYLYVHFEFQGQLKDDFPERLYIYRSLVSLRYQTQNIATFALFTGQSPSDKHKFFEKTCFGSYIYFRYNWYAIIDQSIADLEQSDNMFLLAVLAAKYTLDTEGDDQKRLFFKKKMYELAERKHFSFEKMDELLSFVLDYMLLPDEIENEFQATIPSLLELNSDNMELTRGQRVLNEIYSKNLYGKTFKELEAEKDALLAEKQAELVKKDLEWQAELAKQEAEKQAILAKQEAERLAEKEVEHKFAIKALLKLDFSPDKIVTVLGYDLEYILKLIEKIKEEEKEELNSK